MKENGNHENHRYQDAVVNAQLRKWVFVKVEIDVPVLVRWGEASLEWKTRSVVGAVEDQGG